MRQLLEAIRKRPKLCVWEITSRCNMRCLHCASDLYDRPRRGPELSTDQALSVCRQLADLGCERVVLSGGEALLRKDWEDLARLLVSLGLEVALITNGWLMEPALAERIRDAGISRVAVSIDGNREAHDHVRDNPRSFERVCRAARLLVAAGLPVNVVTHVNALNLPLLADLEDLVVELGASVWRLQLGSPLGRLAEHPELVILPEDIQAVAEAAVAAKERGRVLVSVGDNIGYYTAIERPLRHTPARDGLDFWCGCSAGCLTVGIEANGNVKGCLALQDERFVEGNLREQSLREIWERPGAFAFTREFETSQLTGHCKDCDLGEVCRGGCTFMAVGATGRAHDNPYCLHGIARRAEGAR